MGKFSKYDSPVKMKSKPYKIHPIWQGIGCLLLILIPIMSYAGGVLFVGANLRNKWVPMPPELYGPPSSPGMYGYLAVAVILSLFGFIVFVIFSSILYRFIGPKKTMDAPPPTKRRKSPSKR